MASSQDPSPSTRLDEEVGKITTSLGVHMRIEHVALWTNDLERCKQFYVSHFGAVPGAEYVNPAKGFESCFLSFSAGARSEVMKATALSLVTIEPGAQRLGLTHIAISVGSEQLVDVLTERLRGDSAFCSRRNVVWLRAR
jgi:lactoylglutathione lyase